MVSVEAADRLLEPLHVQGEQNDGLEGRLGSAEPISEGEGLQDDWADVFPFDVETTFLDQELDLEQYGFWGREASSPLPSRSTATECGQHAGVRGAAADFDEEPPVSQIVQSYFHTASTKSISSTAPTSVGGGSHGSQSMSGGRSSEAQTFSRAETEAVEEEAAELQRQRASLEQQLQKCMRESESLQRHRAQLEQSKHELAKEREILWSEIDAERKAMQAELEGERNAVKREKRLRLQLEQAERDFAKEKERLWSEVEAEKRALHAEFDSEKLALRKEKRRLSQSAERQRHLMTEDREAQEERRALKERNEQLADELREKEKRWQRTVDRLQRQIADLTQKNQELQEEVKRANLQARLAEGGAGLHGDRTAQKGPEAPPPAPEEVKRATLQARLAECAAAINSDRRIAPKNQELQEESKRANLEARPAVDSGGAVTGQHGDRTEKIFPDGRREVQFSNGLRKVMWPDGRATVFFQNGDRKEIHQDKVVVYHYCETGAVQTTLPDGTELYRFADGQLEKHYPDGSKEIRFPNGTSKQIFTDGSEEIVFADGTVRRTPGPGFASGS